MELDDDSWHVVKNTPGVNGLRRRAEAVALSKGEVDRILHVATLEQKRGRPPSSRSGRPSR